MLEESAIVVNITRHQAWVVGESNSACGGCPQKTACTSNALSSILKKKAVPVDSDMPLKTGDKVIVAIDEILLLRAAVLLYLVPLISLFISAGIADYLLPNDIAEKDVWLAGIGLLGFFLTLYLINLAQKLLLFSYYARPVVIKKL